MTDKRKAFGLTQAEWDNLLQAIKYGVIIVIAVLLTFAIVASVTRLIGYTPPPPSSSIETLPVSTPIR